MCKARLGLKAPAWARLPTAWASQNLKPGRHFGLRLGSGLARPRPRLCTSTLLTPHIVRTHLSSTSNILHNTITYQILGQTTYLVTLQTSLTVIYLHNHNLITVHYKVLQS